MVGFSHYMKKNLTCCSSTRQRVAWERVYDMEYMEGEFSYNRFYHDAKNTSVQRFSNKKTKKLKNVDEKHHSTPHKKTKFNQTNMNLNNEVNDSVNSVDIFFGRFKKHSNTSHSQEKHMNDGKGSVCKRSSEINIHYDFESESLSDVDWSWSLEDVGYDGRRSLLKISASRLLEQYDLEASKMDYKNSELSTKTGSKEEPRAMEVIIKGIASKLDAVEQKLLEQDNNDNANTRRLIANDINNFDEERNGVEPRLDDLINTYITTKSDENHHKKAIRDTQSVTSEPKITSPSTLPLARSNDSRNQSCCVYKKCDNPKSIRNEALSASCERPIEIPDVEEKRFQNAIEYSLQFGSFSSRSSEEDENGTSYGKEANDFDGASTSSCSSGTIGEPEDCSYMLEESDHDLNTDSRDNYNISDYLENSDDEGPRGKNDIHLIEPETNHYVEYGNSFVESDEDSYYAVKTIHQRMETIREEDEEHDSYSRQISIVSIISES